MSTTVHDQVYTVFLLAKLAQQYGIKPSFNKGMHRKAVSKPLRISELNCEKSVFVFVQTLLLNASVNLMSEYTVALGHYTIPFEMK